MYNRQKFKRTHLRDIPLREREIPLHKDSLPRGWFTFNLETGEIRPAVSAGHAIASCCSMKKIAGRWISHPIFYGEAGWCDVDILSKEELAGTGIPTVYSV